MDGLLHVEADDTGSRRVAASSSFRARGDAAQRKLANQVVHDVAAEVTQAVNKHKICAPSWAGKVSIGQCRRRQASKDLGELIREAPSSPRVTDGHDFSAGISLGIQLDPRIDAKGGSGLRDQTDGQNHFVSPFDAISQAGLLESIVILDETKILSA